MLLAPGVNCDVVYVAEPAVSVSVARTVVPFRYLILPVGVPANDETCAVKATSFPDTEGFMDETRAVVVVVVVVVSTKFCNCLLLPTNTKPFATTGTRFAFPPRFGHAPAVPANNCTIVLP